MKKFITIGLLACAFASTAFAAEAGAGDAPYQTVRLGVSVDYTTVAMDQVNKDLNKGGNITKLVSGITGMADFDVILLPFLMVGARAGYLYCFPASASYNYVLFNQTTTFNASLIPLEAGLIANFEIPASPVAIMAGVFGGYGFAFASVKNDISALGQTATFTQPFNGGGFVGEALAVVSYKLASTLSLNINGGYRLANIPQMVQTEDVSYTVISGITVPVGKKGDVLKDSDNNALVFDFSGFNIGVGLSLGF
jgi:hypothetical protein